MSTPRFYSVLTVHGAAAAVTFKDSRGVLVGDVFRPLAPSGAGEFLFHPWGWPPNEHVAAKLVDVSNATARESATWEEHRDTARAQRKAFEEARGGR